ncbi:MAG: head GIN domain-containing protein [Deltaproteobacteria bacterium]
MRIHGSVPVAVLAALTAAGCDRISGLRGSGHPRSEQRTVETFDQVQISGGLNATVVVGPAVSLAITADDNLLPLITSRVDHGQLQIRTTQSISSVTPVNIQVSVPSLTTLDVSGGVTVTATGINAPSFDVHASGGSSVTIGGRAPQFSATLSGGVQLQADGLVAERVRIDGTGGVRASIFASQQIDGAMAGGAMLEVQGNPGVRRVNASGAAMVTYR